MITGSWTDEQKAAYYAAFTLERIGDEIFLVVAVLWGGFTLAALDRFEDMSAVMAITLVGVGVSEWVTRHLLVPWLASTMPAELRTSLPSDRFSGPSSPNAPRTYRELLRRWWGLKA
jgi:hypothetical protein